MEGDKIWMLAEGGRPVMLHRGEDGIYREPVNVKMVFLPGRYTCDLTKQKEIEAVGPYHFKGRHFLMLLLGVAIGMVASATANIEPIVSAIIVATFAFTTVLFHTKERSEYQLIRMKGEAGIGYFVVKEEDLPDLEKNYSNVFVRHDELAPSALSSREKAQVEIQRYALVTTSAGIALGAMSDLMRAMIEGNVDYFTSGAVIIVASMALVIAVTGIVKISSIAITVLRKEGERISKD